MHAVQGLNAACHHRAPLFPECRWVRLDHVDFHARWHLLRLASRRTGAAFWFQACHARVIGSHYHRLDYRYAVGREWDRPHRLTRHRGCLAHLYHNLRPHSHPTVRRPEEDGDRDGHLGMLGQRRGRHSLRADPAHLWNRGIRRCLARICRRGRPRGVAPPLLHKDPRTRYG